MKKIPVKITDDPEIFNRKSTGFRKLLCHLINKNNQFNKCSSEFNKDRLILHIIATVNSKVTTRINDGTQEFNLYRILFIEVFY